METMVRSLEAKMEQALKRLEGQAGGGDHAGGDDHARFTLLGRVETLEKDVADTRSGLQGLESRVDAVLQRLDDTAKKGGGRIMSCLGPGRATNVLLVPDRERREGRSEGRSEGRRRSSTGLPASRSGREHPFIRPPEG